MSLVLRLDIDKPFGRSNVSEKVFSKLREDFYFPAVNALGYLKDLDQFLDLLAEKKIPSFIYHRLCTAPPARMAERIRKEGHLLGLHAEDTRSIESFSRELRLFQSQVPGFVIETFTKHGSGQLKLGRRHFAPYEPEKYRAWAEELNLKFPFGNDIAESRSDFLPQDGFFPKMYWLEPGYQSEYLNSTEAVLDIAEVQNLVLIVHPENLRAIPVVRERFLDLVNKARDRNISFTTELD